MTGAGPSRRSHTKSRTGCKTCKRRHIRCDETFPQCKNCTKHQVRCDYQDAIGTESVGATSPPDSDTVVITTLPSVEADIDSWKQTGDFPFVHLRVFPTPQPFDLSRNDLRLLHHVCSVASDLQMAGTDHLTLWAEKIPKFLTLASSFPFVMHAILSFSANHLSWAQSSSAIRSLQVHHGGIALRGLHDAIGNFSQSNANAILAASMLMCWQSTDWLSFSSLTSGMDSVLNAMQSWQKDLLFREMFPDKFMRARALNHEQQRRGVVSLQERNNLVNATVDALQRLQVSLVGHDLELHWTGQLLAYMYRYQASTPAQTPEEQFEHAYVLRKWLFWVPISLMQQSASKGPSLLVLAHLYATALSLKPLFPDLIHTYSTCLVIEPLETIVGMTDAMQMEHGASTSSLEIAALMHFPRQVWYNHRDQLLDLMQGSPESRRSMSSVTYSQEAYVPSQVGDLSPAFTPAPPHDSSLSMATEFLAVPMAQEGFSYGTSNWGAMPSPGFPPLASNMPAFDSSDDFRGLHGGFVNPLPIWT